MVETLLGVVVPRGAGVGDRRGDEVADAARLAHVTSRQVVAGRLGDLHGRHPISSRLDLGAVHPDQEVGDERGVSGQALGVGEQPPGSSPSPPGHGRRGQALQGERSPR